MALGRHFLQCKNPLHVVGDWIGPVSRSVGTTLYTAFWDDDTDERYLECAKKIVDEIMQRINHKPIKELLRERMDMVIAKKTVPLSLQDEGKELQKEK